MSRDPSTETFKYSFSYSLFSNPSRDASWRFSSSTRQKSSLFARPSLTIGCPALFATSIDGILKCKTGDGSWRRNITSDSRNSSRPGCQLFVVAGKRRIILHDRNISRIFHHTWLNWNDWDGFHVIMTCPMMPRRHRRKTWKARQKHCQRTNQRWIHGYLQSQRPENCQRKSSYLNSGDLASWAGMSSAMI